MFLFREKCLCLLFLTYNFDLQIETNADFGRYLVAIKDIKAGDIVLKVSVTEVFQVIFIQSFISLIRNHL